MSSFISHFELGLIGYPLGHSLSPQIHTAALQSCNLEGNYFLFPVSPDNTQGLKDLLSRVRFGEIQGLNVTIPHKQTVMQFLDELTPTAQAVGAVNTIYLRGNELIGDNTDAPGFLKDLNRFLGNQYSQNQQIGKSANQQIGKSANRQIGKSTIANRKSSIVNRKSAVVLGAGGSARAIVYALLNEGWKVTLVARRIEQAHELALLFPNYEIPTMDYGTFVLQPLSFNLFVNTTPVGMAPNIDQSPWPASLAFPPHAAIYDLVYNPRQTKLVKAACLQGLSATTGLGMLVEQAALAFEIWTGYRPARQVMLDAVHQTSHLSL